MENRDILFTLLTIHPYFSLSLYRRPRYTPLTPLRLRLNKMSEDFRILHNLLAAGRIKEPFSAQKPNSLAKQQGLRYEKNVKSQLEALQERKIFGQIEHNPWFEFTDDFGSNICSPDFIVHTSNGVIVVEVKLTWVPVALEKLDLLYGLVVAQALQCDVAPLVICKNLAPGVGDYATTLKAALYTKSKVLHWPKIGNIQWE